jgi:hypothetical protein
MLLPQASGEVSWGPARTLGDLEFSVGEFKLGEVSGTLAKSWAMEGEVASSGDLEFSVGAFNLGEVSGTLTGKEGEVVSSGDLEFSIGEFNLGEVSETLAMPWGMDGEVASSGVLEFSMVEFKLGEVSGTSTGKEGEVASSGDLEFSIGEFNLGEVSGTLDVSWAMEGKVASSDCFIVGVGRVGKSQGRGTCRIQNVSKAIQINRTGNVTIATGMILVKR